MVLTLTGLQGFHPEKWCDLTTTLDGPEVDVFKEACIKNKVLEAACTDCTIALGLARHLACMVGLSIICL